MFANELTKIGIYSSDHRLGNYYADDFFCRGRTRTRTSTTGYCAEWFTRLLTEENDPVITGPGACCCSGCSGACWPGIACSIASSWLPSLENLSSRKRRVNSGRLLPRLPRPQPLNDIGVEKTHPLRISLGQEMFVDPSDLPLNWISWSTCDNSHVVSVIY